MPRRGKAASVLVDGFANTDGSRGELYDVALRRGAKALIKTEHRFGERDAAASPRSRSKDKVRLLLEAVALEEAGSIWSQSHAAAICNRSVSFIRNSDCPKSYEDGQGAKGKPMLVYEPAKVRAWMASRIRTTMSMAMGDQTDAF
jgi:hypothetical protein